MIRISQVKMPVDHTRQDLYEKAARMLRISPESIRSLTIRRQSCDARKKDQIHYVYTLDVETDREEQTVKRARSPQICLAKDHPYVFPGGGKEVLRVPPVIIGSGPAGLFCGLFLAQAGFCPVILERGDAVEQRRQKVEHFWKTGVLDTGSNVQFGEGGAGTFSDGKLNTLVKDPLGRQQQVFRILAEYGADPSILYSYKPHVGTDVLGEVVTGIRRRIEELGGTVRFGAQVTDLLVENGAAAAVEINGRERMPVQVVIPAIGHSARDTFAMFLERGIPMEPKAFAVGLRIQHPQAMINESQYGKTFRDALGPAPYKVTARSSLGRGVYSFCMCPGGYVVNASSEPEMLAVNGMSYHDRGGRNANSALIVTVTPEDFGSGVLAGVEYQRKLERLAYRLGNGKIPIQLYGDFRENRESRQLGDVEPEFKGAWAFANLQELLPDDLSRSLLEGMEQFETKIRGFSRYDAILAGVESRTSSPVRMPRDERLESAIRGVFPCGEGAGYAGGITSAAMDGMRAAEEISRRFCTAG